VSNLEDFVAKIRRERNLSDEVPNFDPNNGNEVARFLFLLEAPGPKAIETGFISFDNPDETARNFKRQLTSAGINRKDIALWNVVPWYLGNASQTKISAATSQDVKRTLHYLKELLGLLSNLECIVLVGAAARKSHVYLSQHTKLRILSCHHPSPRAINISPEFDDENISVFKTLNN
jgi:uracil-DNA glycosylase